MALDSSPICFRLSEEDHELLALVALHAKKKISAFVRDAAVKEARAVLAENEAEIVTEYLAETQRIEREVEARNRRVSRMLPLSVAASKTTPAQPVRKARRSAAGSKPSAVARTTATKGP